MNLCAHPSSHRILCTLACLLGLLVPAADMRTQTVTPDATMTGRLWVVAFPDTTVNTVDNRFYPTLKSRIQIFLYSPVDGNVVSIQANNSTTELTLSAGEFEVYDVPTRFITETGVRSNNTIRLESQQPILLYCFMITKFGGEAWTPLPVEAWGTEYYAATLPGVVIKDVIPGGEFNYNALSKAAPAEIMVLSAFDSTLVTIETDAKLAGKPNLKNVLLMANQAYLVQSFVDTSIENYGTPQADLAGSHIVANRPIAVLSGTTRTSGQKPMDIGLGQNSMKNLVMEWLCPTDQHGREFVYMPTWDNNRLTGDPNEIVEEKRSGEFIRAYGSSAATANLQVIVSDTTAIEDTTRTTVATGTFAEIFLQKPQPAYLRTDLPAQVMMNSVATVKFNGTILYWGDFVGASYSTKATSYMTQLIPREQWVDFIPFYVPKDPSNMNHYINVVTDSASIDQVVYKLGPPGQGTEQKFVFKQGNIPGSDLVWGTMQLVPGNTYYIRGTSPNVKFAGFAYGTLAGYELYRPGKVKKWGDNPHTASGGDTSIRSSLLHPSEYEENVAISYGYPLGFAHRVLKQGDSVTIDTLRSCRTLEFTIRSVNSDPIGLASIELAPDAQNARIVYLDPKNPNDIIARTSAAFSVVPVDPSLDAAGTIVITDRTGKRWTVPYSSTVVQVTFDKPDQFDLGETTLRSCDEQLLVATNPSQLSLHVDELSFVKGTEGFKVTRTDPPLPADLAPGATLSIWICNTPTRGEALYNDSLIVSSDCIHQTLAVRTEGVKPCIRTTELGPDTIHVARGPVTRTLQLCNDGRGYLLFSDSTGLPPAAWLGDSFTITQADMDRLKNARLISQECMIISVTFTPSQPGTYRTTIHFRTNTVDCPDSVTWNVVVVSGPLDAPETDEENGYRLQGTTPNPFSRTTEIEFSLGRSGHTTLTLFDGSGKSLATLVEGNLEQGEHRVIWDASDVPAGTYYCRLVSGNWKKTITMVVLH